VAGRALVEVGSDERRAEIEKLIGLNDHDESSARAAHFHARRAMPASERPRRGPSAGRRRRELGHLLANDAPFFAILFVSSKTTHLLADRRSDTAPRRGFAEGGAHRLRIGQSIGPDDVERRDGAVVENVERTRHAGSGTRRRD
jgi:hypothetical protein